MNNICIKLICTLILFIVLSGCEKTVEQGDSVLAVDPVAEKVALPKEFASLAIEASGGLETWGKVRQINLNCIVTSYNKDAGYYLTEQKYEIFPWSDSIVIKGKELRKSYKWQFSKGKFATLEGVGLLNNLKDQIQSDCLAEAILNIIAVPARFIDNSFVYTRGTTEVNLQGRWSYPITVEASDNDVSVSKNETVYYQNKADSKVDMLLLTCANDGACFLVCGYDYRATRNSDVLIPTRIEIHLTDKSGNVERQLFRIDVL